MEEIYTKKLISKNELRYIFEMTSQVMRTLEENLDQNIANKESTMFMVMIEMLAFFLGSLKSEQEMADVLAEFTHLVITRTALYNKIPKSD